MRDTVFLVCLSAFMLAGDMVVPGDIAEVTDSEARDLLGRGKARPATAADGVPDDEELAQAAREAAEGEGEPEVTPEPEKPATEPAKPAAARAGKPK